jgi:magnesium-transporting ATPase (P-type)
MSLILCFKSSTISIFSPQLKYNPWIFYSSLISIVLTVLLIITPGLNTVFSLAPLPVIYWVYAVLFSLIPILFAETFKLYKYLKKRNRVVNKV